MFLSDELHSYISSLWILGKKSSYWDKFTLGGAQILFKDFVVRASILVAPPIMGTPS